MKSPEPADSSESQIAVVGRAVAARRKASTLDRCKEAMSAIEHDVTANDGVYPFNGGRITVQEVLRRANLSAAALEKAHHRSLKAAVSDWAALSSKRIAGSSKTIRRIVTQRVSDANSQVRQIQQRWAEAELAYVDAQNEIARLSRENAGLRHELDVLRNEISNNAVVPFKR